jgi:hypothetical protein
MASISVHPNISRAALLNSTMAGVHTDDRIRCCVDQCIQARFVPGMWHAAGRLGSHVRRPGDRLGHQRVPHVQGLRRIRTLSMRADSPDCPKGAGADTRPCGGTVSLSAGGAVAVGRWRDGSITLDASIPLRWVAQGASMWVVDSDVLVSIAHGVWH